MFNTYYVTKSADINIWLSLLVGGAISLLTIWLTHKYQLEQKYFEITKQREIEKLSDYKEKMAALYYEMMKHTFFIIEELPEYKNFKNADINKKEEALNNIKSIILSKVVKLRLDYVHSWDMVQVYLKKDKTKEKLKELDN